MQRCTSSIIGLVDIHIFEGDKVIKGAGLVTLSGYMQHICTIDVFGSIISVHLLYHELNQLNVAMVG